MPIAEMERHISPAGAVTEGRQLTSKSRLVE
jgi:hypothetical protein